MAVARRVQHAVLADGDPARGEIPGIGAPLGSQPVLAQQADELGTEIRKDRFTHGAGEVAQAGGRWRDPVGKPEVGAPAGPVGCMAQ